MFISTAAVRLAEGGTPVVAPTEQGGVFSLLWLIIALPALGAAVILLLGNRRTSAWAHLLGTATVVGSFVVGADRLRRPAGPRTPSRARSASRCGPGSTPARSTPSSGSSSTRCSALFVLLITGVGSLIHVYSIGYMEHDERRARFFAYLNLFIAAMLTLVLADGYLGVFLGWEGVGLASYLLIGFWQHKTSAAVAAKKAFVVNRVGDIGLALGTMLMIATFGTVSFAEVSELAEGAGDTTLTVIGLLLLLAACGKSAQVPLQSWLLDAMEGPTPVSALIHAATMVTAGVYLVVRSNFIFERTEVGQHAVAIVGVVTLLVGAVIGCAKDDIKKALAGSTMSQIGYMMLAAGLGVAGYAYAIFHLLTHGFFKANMFLGAGSVMHAMDDDVDMRHYGALQKALPVTFLTFAMGYLAIIGFPGFSGFWSKDKIIESAFGESLWLGLAALLGAGITAFYMTRLMLMTFFGEKRWSEDVHPHESPKVMTFPLIVLAALSVLGGLLYLGGWIKDWLKPVVGEEAEHSLPLPPPGLHAHRHRGRRRRRRRRLADDRPQAACRATAPTDVRFATRAARADLYGDAFNEAVLMRPGNTAVDSMVRFDDGTLDHGVVDGTGRAAMGMAGTFRKLQTGYVRSYALSVLLGALIVTFALLAVNFA